MITADYQHSIIPVLHRVARPVQRWCQSLQPNCDLLHHRCALCCHVPNRPACLHLHGPPVLGGARTWNWGGPNRQNSKGWLRLERGYSIRGRQGGLGSTQLPSGVRAGTLADFLKRFRTYAFKSVIERLSKFKFLTATAKWRLLASGIMVPWPPKSVCATDGVS